MRTVKTFSDVNIALRELYDFKDQFTAKVVDFKGRRIANIGNATQPTDAANLSQIPVIAPVITPTAAAQIFTINFSKDSALVDLNTSPAFVIGSGKQGIPIEVWVVVGVAPSGGAFTCNPTFNGLTILKNPISIPSGSTDPVFSSTFVDPVPVFSLAGAVLPGIITANNAALFSMGIVVKTVAVNK